MAQLPYVPGLPGVKALFIAQPKIIFRQCDWTSSFGGGRVIDGTNARDWSNTPYTYNLQPGLLMGKITSTPQNGTSSIGQYGATILGVSQNAYTSGGTSITVTAPQAVEIVRRIGTSGNLNYVGPPTTSGTNAVLGPIAFSAVNTTTGVITTSTLGANLIAGGFVTATDGSGVPNTFISDDEDGQGRCVVDESLQVSISVPFPLLPIAGVVISSNIIGWPTNAVLQNWIATSISTQTGGKFVWDFMY